MTLSKIDQIIDELVAPGAINEFLWNHHSQEHIMDQTIDEFVGPGAIKLAFLQDRIRQDVLEHFKEKGLKNFHVTLGPKALDTPYEELLQMNINMLDETDARHQAWNALSETEKLKWNIKHLSAALQEIHELSRGSKSGDFLETLRRNNELALFQNKIDGIVEFADMELRHTDTYNPHERHAT